MSSVDIDTVNIREFLVGNDTLPTTFHGYMHVTFDGFSDTWIGWLFAFMAVMLAIGISIELVNVLTKCAQNCKSGAKKRQTARPLLRADDYSESAI
tara:strand:- start:313 stop:600 length:288 start_codon:yes stop_codon:yes gene_type:complete